MKRLINLKLSISIFSFCFAFYGQVLACNFIPESLLLELSKNDDGFELRASNIGDRPISINSGFRYGGNLNTSPVELQLKDHEENQYKINGVVNSRISRNQMILDRSHFYGRVYSNNSIKHCRHTNC